ncbi:MAG TPA: aminotransferase class V-fold PLP-dependent enzyme [Exilispira sp.]|nr:aminotransferase class V-fold PLP-dependent enzyme [Exilispira sp.]
MIYFDNAATTKPLDIAIKKFDETTNQLYANPSSLHIEGKKSKKIIEDAKQDFNKIINAKIGQVIFTSSATLSNNIAISGMIQYLKGKIKNRKLKILYSEADHPSIVETVKAQRDVELISIKFDKLYKYLIENKDIEEYILSIYYENITQFKPDLLILQWVNNENGLILPIEKITKFVKENVQDILIHLDAVQGFLKIPFFGFNNVDTMSFSAHKFGGLKGTSILYIKEPGKIIPIIFGGGQMEGIFPSTENVGSISSTIAVINDLFPKIQKNYRDNLIKKEYLIWSIKKDELLSKSLFVFSNKNFIEDDISNSNIDNISEISFKEFIIEKLNIEKLKDKNIFSFSPYIMKIYNDKIPAAVLQNILSDEGIMVSIGSACSSNRKKMVTDTKLYGLPSNISDKGIRVSFFINETKEDIDQFIDKMKQIIKKYKNW